MTWKIDMDDSEFVCRPGFHVCLDLSMVRVQSLRIRSPPWKDESIAPVFQHRPARFFLPNIITQPRHASSATGRDDSWQTVIGLEIHAQLKTGRKLFSSRSLFNLP